MNKEKVHISQFALDIEKGLSAPEKYIASKYFYDAAGDAIFQKIMQLPEYYLTACELEIFQEQSAKIIRDSNLQPGVQIIELGAGDGTKTQWLLKEIMRLGIDFTYHPIDISANVLNGLQQSMQDALGDKLSVVPVIGDYFDALLSSEFSGKNQKFILFLGSTIGNFDSDNGSHFISRLSNVMSTDDQLLVGFDLKKDAQIIADAYNDSAGVTRDFNLNLLHRINHELDANFDVDQFTHYPIYDVELGAAKSYLRSKIKQEVFIDALECSFTFDEGEKIFTEISRKYDLLDIKHIVASSHLEITNQYYDSRKYFADVLMKKR